ncbi:Outer membrane translocation and assembly module TamA [Pseudomonas syringae pv. actinidiae]|nr:Outer membrane translocation and assembly module TamA [Pseudomonas syringae pv. actinidiae]
MQAQRAIGGLMALVAVGAPGIGSVFTHRDFFSRLSTLTGSTPDELVIAAGAAI